MIEGVWETEADTCHTHVQGGNFRGTEDWLPELLNIIRIMGKPLSPEKRKKNVDNEQSYFSFKVNVHRNPSTQAESVEAASSDKGGCNWPENKSK